MIPAFISVKKCLVLVPQIASFYLCIFRSINFRICESVQMTPVSLAAFRIFSIHRIVFCKELRTANMGSYPTKSFTIPAIFCIMAQQSQRAKTSTLSRIPDLNQTHHIPQDSSGRVIIPMQRLLPDNTQHSQLTSIHAPAGFEPAIPATRRRPTPQTARLLRSAIPDISEFVKL